MMTRGWLSVNSDVITAEDDTYAPVVYMRVNEFVLVEKGAMPTSHASTDSVNSATFIRPAAVLTTTPSNTSASVRTCASTMRQTSAFMTLNNVRVLAVAASIEDEVDAMLEYVSGDVRSVWCARFV
jgi:hypothetical protein